MIWNKSIFVAAVIVASFCPAQTPGTRLGTKTVIWSPPVIHWPDNFPHSTVPREMISSLRIANLPVILETTKLEDAQKRLGGAIGSRGDGGDSEAWLCIHGSDQDGPWIFWLTSGEIEGLTYISGFQWRHLSDSETPDRRCSLLPQDKGRIELPDTLHPGMTEAEARKVLGRPSLAQGNLLIYCHEHQKIIHKLPYSVENTIGIVLHSGVVQEIDAVKISSS